MQGNQQVPIQYPCDFDYHNSNMNIQNGNQQNRFQKISDCSTFAVAFEDAKEVARRLKSFDRNNELWQKMLFEVSFHWIRQNKEQFKRELERYQEQLINGVNTRIHPNDIRWMKTYIKIMIDILNQEMNAITS